MAKFHYTDSPSEKQKKAFSKYLSEDEELVLVTGVSSAYLRQEFILFLLMPGLFFVLGGGLFGWFIGFSKVWTAIFAISLMLICAILKTVHLYHSNRYIFTTRRAMIKRGIFGVYRVVSAKYLQAYADEFSFRYNHRYSPSGMFDILLNQVPEVKMMRVLKPS